MLKFKLVFAAALMFFSSMSLAYVGPGAGLSAIGSVIALIFAVLVAFVGFVWFPLKRLFKKGSDDEGGEENEDTIESDA